MIQTKDECEQAASLLGYSDTSATEDQIDKRPYGCIYAWYGSFLQWYPSDGSPYQSARCGGYDSGFFYNCICKLAVGKDFRGLVIIFNHKDNI